MHSNQTLKYFSRFIKRFPHLSGREREVLVNRLYVISLEDIGKSYSLTEARIRQIEKHALTKIKSKAHQLALFK